MTEWLANISNVVIIISGLMLIVINIKSIIINRKPKKFFNPIDALLDRENREDKEFEKLKTRAIKKILKDNKKPIKQYKKNVKRFRKEHPEDYKAINKN
ncbi:unnamed protein product [marine sediment metagenome]|uniref:Uncharacterized protein n=1 Tax=marine sediment metagenome TaxID=412755 RepID=X0SNU0_9ZZZZ